MCAALTVPIIKDGYRLYPGMPVSGQSAAGRHGGATRSTSGHKTTKGRNSQLVTHGRMSPPDSVSASGSPPRNGNGPGVRQVLLQPRIRTTSNQSQISARSSFDVAPSSVRPDLMRGRSAMSTSQLYMQQRRELAIQQQLRKQELAKKQLHQQQVQGGKTPRKSPSPAPQLAQRSDSNGNESSVTDYDAEDSLNFCGDDQQRSRKASPGDHNNNKDSSTNPLRKLLKRLGLGSNQQHGNQNHRSQANSLSETSIEQAVPALQCHLSKPEMNVAVAARQ